MTQQTHNDNGFEILEIKNDSASAKIALQGAHVFEYTRTDEAPLLWVSPESFYRPGKAIRGGIPVCWPWFGKNAEYPDWPQHGFARTSLWEFVSVEEPDAGTTVVILKLPEPESGRAFFPYRYGLTLTVTVSDSLSVALTTKNIGDKPFVITEALHTYFSVGSIDAVTVHGLESVTYADNLESFKHKSGDAPIVIDREVDRVYLDTEHACSIDDVALNRKIVVEKSGSRSTVVWNPWIDKAAGMADFSDDGYKTMVCIETANALEDFVTVPPGESHTMTQSIQ